MNAETRENNKALLVGTIIYGIGNIGTKFLSFLIVPLYTYFIQPGDLGDYDLLMTTVSLLSPLLTMKISDATYRWIIKSRDKEESDESIAATYQLLIRNCILCAVLLLLVNQFVPIWNCYYFIAILIGDRVLECIQKLLRGVKNQKLFATSGIFYTCVMLGANLIKVCALREGVAALLQSVILAQASTILMILIFERRIRVNGIWKNHKKIQHEMLSYSIPLVPSALSWWAISASNRYLIRFFLGSVANGIYSVAYKFPTIMQTIFTMFNNSWTDMALARLKQGEATEKYSSELFEHIYKLSFCAVFVLMPATKIVTKLILSEAYKEASIYMGFLYLGTIFQGFSSFCSVGYLQSKKTNGAAVTSIYGTVANLVLDVVLINFIGLHAATISTFAGFFVMWITRMRDVKEVFPININVLKFCVYAITAVIIATITIWTNIIFDVLLMLVFIVVFVVANYKVLASLLSKILR